MGTKREDWETVDGMMGVVRLTGSLSVLVPALFVSAFPLSTRAVSYEGGRFGLVTGILLTGGSIVVAWMLLPLAGIFGPVLSVWLMGTAGVVMIANGMRPLAFVKPICVKCRLLPVIKEHEAIHMAGVEKDDQVWESMKARHSCESLGLDGDPGICWFCPIPKRLRER